MLDELPARLPREPAVVTLGRFGSGFHRREAHARSGLDDLLTNVCALTRHEMLARAICGHAPAARNRRRTFEIRVGLPQQGDALREWHRERIALERGPVFAALWRDRREHDRGRARARRGLGPREGLVDDTAQGHLVGAVGRGETPGPLVNDAEADAPVARARDRFDLAVTHRDRVVFALDVARVGVIRAASRSKVDKLRQLGVALGHVKRLGGRYLEC